MAHFSVERCTIFVPSFNFDDPEVVPEAMRVTDLESPVASVAGMEPKSADVTTLESENLNTTASEIQVIGLNDAPFSYHRSTQAKPIRRKETLITRLKSLTMERSMFTWKRKALLRTVKLSTATMY